MRLSPLCQVRRNCISSHSRLGTIESRRHWRPREVQPPWGRHRIRAPLLTYLGSASAGRSIGWAPRASNLGQRGGRGAVSNGVGSRHLSDTCAMGGNPPELLILLQVLPVSIPAPALGHKGPGETGRHGEH